MSTNVTIDQWEIFQHGTRRSDTTITERIRVLATFEAETGVNPAYAQPLDIVRWYALHEEWSPGTHYTYHSYLTTWFKWLQLQDIRVDNPMVKLGTVKQPKRKPRPVADTHLIALLKTNMHHRTRVMILLATLAGLRCIEIAKFRGEDMDLPRGRMLVLGKGGDEKWVPLHPILAATAETMPVRGWWFPSNRTRPGQHVTRKSVSQSISDVFRRANLPGSAHPLRHWYGTTLLEGGADIRVVQELMRHGSVTSTQQYTGVTDIRMRAAVEKLDLHRAIA
ncbi:tyrosine-type recombinase/integrase [Rhodococcus sp. I2R]|uniref:tyrosine-type recombinase/integrase n=1 Tax=Rhodococcus sp. I2R TaxID=2855445 RepID=UPI001E29EFC6|nr:tyrosine-type recombinase/integrase [Rhodococcus sp. I2R]MCC8930839.1 tyrosine-type recombinase/integrase [Rhodococcus sp. I2R]